MNVAPNLLTVDRTSYLPFRWVFITLLVAMFIVSVYFRWRARRYGGTIGRGREDSTTVVGRIMVAVPLFASFLAYAVYPEWMAWSSVVVPSAVRWLAATFGALLLPVLWWVMTSIGTNVSETYLTKESHELVVHGPYRWVRHPLYTVATCVLASLSVLAANWFMLVMTCVAILALVAFVIPKEEEMLIRKFGDAYREYRRSTGTLLPRFGRRTQE